MIHHAELSFGEEHAALPLAIGFELRRFRRRLPADIRIRLATRGAGRDANEEGLAHREIDAEGRTPQSRAEAARIVARARAAGLAQPAHPHRAAIPPRRRARLVALGQAAARLELAAHRA